MTLDAYGWSVFWSGREKPENGPSEGFGRVVDHQKSDYGVVTKEGEGRAVVSGRLRRQGPSPVVGDWVRLAGSPARWVMVDVFPRRTALSRKEPGRGSREQVLASNVETVFVVMGLDSNFNLRRLERLLTLAWESGARPVVVLHKVDICLELRDRCLEIEEVAPGVPVQVTSCREVGGLDGLTPYLVFGETVALIGSSGVGKSTIINQLLGRDALRTGAVRSTDSRGRHTTTHRALFRLPSGALLIDSPGLREMQLSIHDRGLSQAFEDIETLSAGCRFRDCRHNSEPGCAVLQAVSDGSLSRQRWENFAKMQKEMRYWLLRENITAGAAERKRWRTIHRAARKHRPRE